MDSYSPDQAAGSSRPLLSEYATVEPGDLLTLLLLNMTCPVLANRADPDQLASEEAN